jgi:tetraacyldisaccharide 4'-kinase
MTLAARAALLLQEHWWRAKPSLLSRCLQPLSGLYSGLAAIHRHGAFKRAAQLPVPVVVVGNWVVGGAGKTPTVIALVQALQTAGWRPGILSRGYGGRHHAPHEVAAGDSAHSVGDEPVLMQRRTQVPLWVGRDRVAAGLALCQHHPSVNVLVSDDGLQHHALRRNAEVIVFDERGMGNGLLLPAGPLREALPTAPLAPYQHVLYSNGRASTPIAGTLADRQVKQAWPLAAWWAGDTRQAQPLAALRNTPLLAAAGIAAPDKFFSSLQSAGLHFTPLPLPDHFDYGALPWPADTPHIITTEKDAVKLQGRQMGHTRIWVVPLDLVLPKGFVQSLMDHLQNQPKPAPRSQPHEP